MTQIPPKQNDASYCSSSQSEGDLRKASDGLDPNAEVLQHAMLRYERQLQSDPQLQVHSKPHQNRFVSNLEHTCLRWGLILAPKLVQQTTPLPTPSPAML